MNKIFIFLIITISLNACSSVSNAINPFSETATGSATLGTADDSAIGGDGDRTQNAREALNAMASYRSAHSPQPVNPVIQPAVVRLMWIPDHLNSHGDLVPAHFYYLKVLSDRWAVQDAFELESQLGSKKESSAVPYIYQSQQGMPQQ